MPRDLRPTDLDWKTRFLFLPKTLPNNTGERETRWLSVETYVTMQNKPVRWAEDRIIGPSNLVPVA